MIVGIDFDNTIVCYDSVFSRLASSGGLPPVAAGGAKSALRDHLRSAGREDEWTELQGYAYGPGMEFAEPFAGMRDSLIALRQHGIGVRIISHRTKYPYLGPKHDLHDAAWQWLDRNSFFDTGGIGISRDDVFLELTKAEKLERIAQCHCDAFVDDLPEFLLEPSFPSQARRILFDPARLSKESAPWQILRNWRELLEILVP